MTAPTVNRMITKDEIRGVAKLWTSKTSKDIATELNMKVYHVMRIANLLRKAGVNMPKKHKTGVLRGLINEVAAELK